MSSGLPLAALGAGCMIVLANVLCVAVFSLAVSNSVSLRQLVVDLARNPLILGCVIGVGVNMLGVRLPLSVDGLLALLGKAAFPVGLMAVGAAYCTGNLALHWRPVALSSIVQFFCKPLIAWHLAAMLGLSGMAAGAALLLFSVPTAPSAYILSRQMGGDHNSMATIITVQTCLSFITLPVTIWLLL